MKQLVIFKEKRERINFREKRERTGKKRGIPSNNHSTTIKDILSLEDTISTNNLFYLINN